MKPILPDVCVRLSGTDGNAFAIMGAVTRAMRRSGHASRIEEFRKEATNGNYDHVLQTCFKWVDVS